MCKHLYESMEGEAIEKHLKGGGEGWTLPLFSVIDHERQGPRAERYQKCRRRILISGHRLGTRGTQVYLPFENPHEICRSLCSVFWRLGNIYNAGRLWES